MDKKTLSVCAIALSVALLASYGIPLFTQGTNLVSLAYAEEKMSQDARICGVNNLSPTEVLKSFSSPWQNDYNQLSTFNVGQITVDEDRIIFKKLEVVLKLYNSNLEIKDNATRFEKHHNGWLTVYVDSFSYRFHRDHNRIYLSITNATIILRSFDNDNFFAYINLSEFKSEIGCDKPGV